MSAHKSNMQEKTIQLWVSFAMLVFIFIIGGCGREETQDIIPNEQPQTSQQTGDLLTSLRGQNMPVIADFSAPMCLACEEVDKIINDIENIYGDKLTIVKIDMQKEQVTAQKYNVELAPTVLIFDEKGEEVFRNVGVSTKEQIVKILNEIGVR